MEAVVAAKSQRSRASGRKHRCWMFHVAGITKDALQDAETVNGTDRLIASVRERYTTVKRLAIRPAEGLGLAEKQKGAETVDPSDLVVTIQFAGPQPSQRPGKLLRELLGAASVEAHPVELGRGRKDQHRFSKSPTTSPRTISGVQTCRARMSKKLGKKLGSPPNSIRYSKKHNEDVQVKDEGQTGPATPVPVFGGAEPVRHRGCDDRLTTNPSSTNDNDGPTAPPAHFEQLPLATKSAGPPFDSPAPDEASFPVMTLPRWEDVIRSISTSFPRESSLGRYALDNGWSDPSTNATHNGVSRQTSRFELTSVLNRASGGGFRDNGEECDLTLPSVPSQPRAGSRLSSSTTSSTVEGEGSEAGYLDMDNFRLPRSNAYRADEDQPKASSPPKQIPEMFLTVATTPIELSPIICDFEGCPVPGDDTGSCYLVFAGLDHRGNDLRNIGITAHFRVGSATVSRGVDGPVRAGPDGRAYVEVLYPSMHEIFPELYTLMNIRTVEVDVVVELRPYHGRAQYTEQTLKVTYLRSLDMVR